MNINGEKIFIKKDGKLKEVSIGIKDNTKNIKDVLFIKNADK